MVHNLLNEYRMDRSAFSVRTQAEADAEERVIWHAMSPQERLKIVEYMRQVTYGYDACAGRLQRVLEISQREPG